MCGPISQMDPRQAEGQWLGSGPPPGLSSRGAPLSQLHCLEEPPGNLTVAGLFLELLMTLFSFPMTSNVPPPQTPLPVPCAQSPRAPSVPHSPCLDLLSCAPLLLLAEMVRRGAVPTGVVRVRGDRGASPHQPQPLRCLPDQAAGLELALDSGPGPSGL